MLDSTPGNWTYVYGEVNPADTSVILLNTEDPTKHPEYFYHAVYESVHESLCSPQLTLKLQCQWRVRADRSEGVYVFTMVVTNTVDASRSYNTDKLVALRGPQMVSWVRSGFLPKCPNEVRHNFDVTGDPDQYYRHAVCAYRFIPEDTPDA